MMNEVAFNVPREWRNTIRSLDIIIIQRRAGREETRGDAARDAETTDDDARVVYLVRATRATVRAT